MQPNLKELIWERRTYNDDPPRHAQSLLLLSDKLESFRVDLLDASGPNLVHWLNVLAESPSSPQTSKLPNLRVFDVTASTVKSLSHSTEVWTALVRKTIDQIRSLRPHLKLKFSAFDGSLEI